MKKYAGEEDELIFNYQWSILLISYFTEAG